MGAHSTLHAPAGNHERRPISEVWKPLLEPHLGECRLGPQLEASTAPQRHSCCRLVRELRRLGRARLRYCYSHTLTGTEPSAKRGEQVSQQASPRGTFLKIANALRAQIDADPGMVELPSLRDVTSDHGISRGVALRAFGVLKDQGLAVPAPGGRWRVVRAGQDSDRRALAERIADVISTDKLRVGDPFPSASVLSTRFGVSRPTMSKALDKLETAGLLSEGGQGKVRTVRALPSREERSQS